MLSALTIVLSQSYSVVMPDDDTGYLLTVSSPMMWIVFKFLIDIFDIAGH